MAKLYFRYGAMGASKTANALMVAYNYEEKGLVPLVLKPKIESRDGQKIIKSRIGIQRECEYVEDVLCKDDFESTAYRIREWHKADCVIVDECQFMEPWQVQQLWQIVDEMKIPVMCYGLATDFQQNLFPASAELMKLADKVEEIKTICWCGDGAKCNARLDGKGNVVRIGDQIQLGGTETGLPSYTSLCTKHFISGDIGPKMRAKFKQYEEAQLNKAVKNNDSTREVIVSCMENFLCSVDPQQYAELVGIGYASAGTTGIAREKLLSLIKNDEQGILEHFLEVASEISAEDLGKNDIIALETVKRYYEKNYQKEEEYVFEK